MSSSWVPLRTVRRMRSGTIDEMLRTIKGPKKLIQAWELVRDPPSVWEYMLEKKLQYGELVEKITTVEEDIALW